MFFSVAMKRAQLGCTLKYSRDIDETIAEVDRIKHAGNGERSSSIYLKQTRPSVWEETLDR